MTVDFQRFIHFGLLVGARVLGAASLFAANLLIVHYLGFEALSTYAIFVSLMSVTAVLISAGFTPVAPIFIAEYAKLDQPELRKGFTNNAYRQGAILLFVLSFGLIAAYFSGALVHFEGNLLLGFAALSGAAATAVLGFNSAVLVGMKQQVSGLVPETLFRPLSFLILATLFLASGVAVSIEQILWLLVASIWIALGFFFFWNRKHLRGFSELDGKSDRSRWRNAALPWMGITLLSDFLIDIILLCISIMAGSIEIAILHVCFRYRVLAGFGMRTIHMLMMPEITEESVAGNRAGLQKKLRQVNLASLAYSTVVMLVFAVLGRFLLGIFSTQATGSVAVLLVVSATMIIRAVFGPAALILAIHNFHGMTLKISVLSVIIAISFILIGYGSIGIMAAAIGYTMANLILSACLWAYAKHKTGIDCSMFSIAQGWLGGGVTVAEVNRVDNH